ncbi:uncharacterized protein LOC142772097 [Rhipicephalus microplus]|uniref:uncharacterized protein LOC142772097 n=1 Tax=Rhipicephalus microplus TaxID=6941 RepID=UPI003F6AE77D
MLSVVELQLVVPPSRRGQCDVEGQVIYVPSVVIEYGSSSSASMEEYSSLVSEVHGMHSCRQCTYVTKIKSHMRRHLCQHTGSPFSATSEQYRALVFVEDGLHSCRQCTYVTKSTTRIKLHIRKHTGECPFHCHLCLAVFITPYATITKDSFL